ncbi:DUF3427 domain-containing protein [Occultella gossypii]|uniref:DUF3427 domain-containing protein n=1 Tax=Occultella gossypii TaxID=2800820 RepID=UPI0027DFA2FB|nr:DUF3427 domain-containing protein [Occultella gossypii]
MTSSPLPDDGALVEGAYEELITERLAATLRNLPADDWASGSVPDGDQPHVLAAHVAEAVHRRLRGVKDSAERLALVNQLLDTIDDGETVPSAERLLAVERRLPTQLTTTSRFATRPQAPLSEAALLTNAHGEPSLQSEILAEMPSADEVDLLCAFVKWTGVRTLRPGLASLRDRGVPLRIATTTYMGATERVALDRLVREVGAQVKIQYDVQRTRLHAKAWMFRRRSGFSTAYVGSSNLSHSALLDGVEWNVRLSQRANRALLAKFEATFDTYWADPTFEDYQPDDVEDRDRLDDALAEASGRSQHTRVTFSISGLEVRAYPYQQRMLDEIEAARKVYGRHRNLVVAATGTGKTVVAALDYRRLSEEAGPGEHPRLLFVAHRREILQQSLRTFREVLTDPEFGELYVDGKRPERWKHVFASIQSLTAYGVENIPPASFRVLIVDEFHHAAASTYQKLLRHLTPDETLGLTATPERADGVHVARLFGGAPTTELRLWDAIASDLLAPFHYFAINDETDLSRIAWARGAYDARSLSNLYTGNDARSRIILSQLRDKVADLDAMKALGFCVDVGHAHAMAEAFNQAGIPSRAVTGETAHAHRDEALTDLRSGATKVIFAVDVYNEGVDIPDVNTVLFLRPTESATIFVQQLGRGLRRTRTKSVLTALDFVGIQRKEFRWDLKLGAITGQSRRGLIEGIEKGFTTLPSGCQIVLERESQQRILANVRDQVSRRWSRLVSELRTLSAQRDHVSLGTYLHETGNDLGAVIERPERSWTRLRREAGLEVPVGGPLEDVLLRRVRALAHVDDSERTAAYLAVLSGADYESLSPTERAFARMLFFSLYPDGGGFESYADGLTAASHEAAANQELMTVVDLARATQLRLTVASTGSTAGLPLRLHARYQREEALAALGWANLSRTPKSFQAGVLHESEQNLDALFVTVEKSEAAFSPSTMYRDYPISRTLFHWESQSTTSLLSPTGQRYVAGSSTVLLFVRVRGHGPVGTEPYTYLGPVELVAHQGERPIAITWRLNTPMPLELFSSTTAAAP